MYYLEKVLGTEIVYQNTKFRDMPNYISTRYELKMVSLDGNSAVFIYPKTEPERIDVIKKHIEKVKTSLGIPIVLIIKKITAYQKEYLLRERIPFIVDGKQIYLPFMAVYLQEKCNAEKQPERELLPSAQMLLLYFIYCGAKEMTTSCAAKELKLTPTSVSRASKQLEEMNLIKTKKSGVQKVLFSDQSPKELFENADPKLVDPVKRTVYIPERCTENNLMESKYMALSEYSMLSEPTVRYYATDRISQWNGVLSNSLQDADSQVAVEMWRYDPRKLSEGKLVDELSLALTLRKDTDERVEQAVEEMLENLWRRIDGKRNK